MQQSILLVEDDDSLNRGISLKLSKEGYTVFSAFSIQQGIKLFFHEEIDLIICDVGLPDGSGLDFCRKIRKDNSKILFLFLTALDTEMDIVNGYDVGADDYVTKPFSLMVLISKVNAVMRRTTKKEINYIISGDISILLHEKRAKKNGTPIILSPNEWKLLHMFMVNPKHILSKNQILENLWDEDKEYFDENTIAVNIHRLREKIEEEPSNPKYIKNIRGMGYIWEMECIKK